MPVQHPLPDHVVDRLERDVRVDHAGAVAEQQRRRGALRARRPIRRPARSACACPRAPGGGARRPSPAGWESAPVADRRRGPTGSGCRSRPSTASLARRHSSSIACSSPAPSFSGSNSIDSVVERNGESGGRWRSFATCSLWMIGYLILICRHDSGSGFEQVALGPDRRAQSTSPAPRGSRRAAGSSPARTAA